MTYAGTLPPRIYLDHGEAYGNLGDDAMLVNAVRRIQERIGPCSFVLPVRDGCTVPTIEDSTIISSPGFGPQGRIMRRATPDAVWRIAGAVMARSSLWARRWRRAVRALRGCDALYCVGAACMNEWGKRGPLLTKWALIKTARRLGKPVIVSSQTIGPFRSRWPLMRTAEAVEMADHFSFRDRGVSLGILKAAGVDTSELLEVGDEAFSLPPARVERGRAWLAAARVDPDRPFGLIQFRATDYTRRTSRHYPRLAAALDRLATDVQLVFLPMSRGSHGRPDARCGDAIRRLMARPERMRVLTCPSDAGLARRLVAMARWVASLSYHLQVFAIGEGTPVLQLVSGDYYRHKAVGLNGWAQGRLPAVDLGACSSEELCARIASLEVGREEHVAVLRRAARAMAQVNDLPIEALDRSLHALEQTR
jgi:polysaccharide pyruvyl transferase WcaK-like protein